jgi:tetratricopeptide (TPR) repeat protein
MSVETIRMVLGRLQDDPDDEAAWNELAEAITAPNTGVETQEIERLLGLARAKHEQRREWTPVARLLEMEIAFAAGSPVEGPMQAELARIYHEELVDVERATAAYKRLLQVRPNDPTATEALEHDEEKRARWRELVTRYLSEAESAGEDTFKSALYASAADTAYRYGRAEDPQIAGVVAGYLERALELDKRSRRAANLAELVYTNQGDFTNVARVQELLLRETPIKEDKTAAGLRLGRTAARKLGDARKATGAYQTVLDLAPGQEHALAYLVEAYSASEEWDHLVALYEDQLRGGGVRPAEELGVLVQIAMVHWRMRRQPQAAEPYFDRVRRADPAHMGMLAFFRETCTAKGEKARLVTILTDAQRALRGGDEKRALATEIARLAESQENAQKAIEQYKTILRTDPDHREARDALKRLYAQTGGHNALVELYRQDLERAPADDVATRVGILREIASIYRDRTKSESALVTVLTQIAQLDEGDIGAVRELAAIYESLGRFRDLLSTQQRLAELSPDPAEKAQLYRAAARRWMEQFSNVQNAVAAYESLLDIEPTDAEAIEKLRELYLKRRAWPQLYTLYEKQLPAASGAVEIELLTELAKLAAERLDRGADAIRHYKRILDVDPQAPGAFDALEKQAEREKDFATLAEVLEKRVDVATDEATRLAVLQKLGAVYSDRVKDPAATARTWRRVLALSPGHARALRVLRDAYVAAGDWDGLEELYASQGDWETFVDFLTGAADKAEAVDKVAISRRCARIYEEKLGAPERAARSYERVLSVLPTDAAAASALVPIYEIEEKWARLPALYEILLGAAEDDDTQVALLRKLATTTGGPLADKQAAASYARHAYELAPTDENLDLLESWSRAASAWEPFASVVEARLKKKKGLTVALKRALRLKLAEIYARELGKLDEAIAAYRELVESDPTDADAVHTLDTILRTTGRRDDLRWLFRLRADQVGGDARADILEEWATLEEEIFGDNAGAASLLQQVVELAPGRGDALRSLARLLMQSGEHAAAARVIERHRDVSEGEARARREVDLAALYLDPLERPKDAFDACARALELSEHDPDAVALLVRLLERPETRVEAARVLAAEYAAAGDARREVEARSVMLETEADPARRLALYGELATVHEEKLDEAGTALDVVLRALSEFPEDLPLWDRAADLSQQAARPGDLAEAYRKYLVDGGAKRLPEAVELELCERAASLHDERLGDADGARPYLERVLAVMPTNERAFARLKQILTAAERWSELEQLYDRAAQGTTDLSARVELLNEVALIAEEIIGSAEKAIFYYERIREIDPHYSPAVASLEKLYEREGLWDELARLLERRLDAATDDETVTIKRGLGRIYLDRLKKPEAALAHLEDVLALRPGDAGACGLVERLLDEPALRQRAARTLEAVYEGEDDVRSLVGLLDIRLEAVTDDDGRRDLYRRIATYRDERLKDDAGAFAALAELLPLEPEDAATRERFVEIGRRLGEHERVAAVLSAAAERCRTAGARGQILMEVARICENLLEDEARAERVYKAVVEIDPNDPDLVIPAAQALSRIYTTSGRHDALAGSLAIEVRLEPDTEARRALYERVGTLYETVLDDPAKAIDAFRARLGDDPADVSALAALERLYERTEAYRELVAVLRTREQVSVDADERRRTMVRAAEILAGKLDDLAEAINAWRAVLDEFGPERPTLAALAALYAKAERWIDLAETVEVDLSLADEPADRIALLARLGDVRRLHQDDLAGALDAYRQALGLDPSHEPSRFALEMMLENPNARAEAAATLRPLYEAEGDAEKLLRVLEIQVEAADTVGERLETLQTALRTAEGPLADTHRAFGYAERGVRLSAGESDVASWIETLERLAAATGRWGEATALYRDIEGEILDGEVQQDVRLRVGELARQRLADTGLAIEHYRKALDARADDRRAMLALEELYGEANDAPRLLEILQTRVEYAEDDAEKKRLLYRVAELQKGPLGDAAAAASTYEELLGLALEEPAIRALEALYQAGERHADLIGLYERELDAGSETPADLRVKIAVVAHRSLGDVSRAFDELAEALSVDPGHEGAIVELEGLLADGDAEQRARAGEMLENVYLRRADWAKVLVALDARLAATLDPGDRRELLQRLATLHEEQLEDYRAALETVALLLHEDLADEDVWRELERLAKVAGATSRLAEIYAKELDALSGDDASSAKLCRITGELYASQPDDEAALRWYRRAHRFEPESRELFQAIDEILVRQGKPAERVELYRAALDYREGEGRVEALHTIADLYRHKLDDARKAIETYRAVLDESDQDTRALDALTELFRDLGEWQSLADLHLRRAEAAPNAEEAATHRLLFARLAQDKLGDAAGAIDQLEAIVAEVPWHAEAIVALEGLLADPDHKARVIDVLRPLYERSDDWRKLIGLNAQRLELVSAPRDKVDILRETASLWETRGDDAKQAFAAYRAAFAIDPEDAELRGELERLAEALTAWEELAGSYERGAASATDDLVKRELLSALSRVYDQRIDDPRRALDAYARLSALDPSDPEPLEAMDNLAVLLADWSALITVLEKKSVIASDEDNASIHRRIAETKVDMLDDVEGAIAAYERALELDPSSAFTIDRLIELYEPRDAARRLVELYALRVDLATSDEADLRYELNVSAAGRYESSLANPREAIGALSAALEARPGDAAVLKALERLYRAEQMWHELLENLKLQASAAEAVDERVALRRAMSDLYAGALDSPAEALETSRLILEEAPADDHAIRQGLALGEANENLRLDAADVLEPVLRAAGRHEDLVTVLELRLRAQVEPADRARTLRTIASVYDADLDRPKDAVTVLLRALEDAPDDAFLHQEIERLAERAGDFAGYADVLAQRTASLFDAAVGKDLWLRLGRIAEEKLHDDARAVEAYAKAVEHAGDTPELLEALDRLYGRLGDAKALADVLERRVTVVLGDREQADLYHRLAALQIESFGDKAQGLVTLRQALERAPDHAAARAALEKLTDQRELFDEAAEILESVYRAAGDHAALTSLGEKRVGYAEAPADRLRLRLDLARIQEEQCDDPKAAQATIERALADDPTDTDALAELERLAPVNDGWTGAADALEKVVRAREELPSEAARDLWTRIATWRRDKTGDAEGAERALDEALKHDRSSEWVLRAIETLQRAPGREHDLVGTLRRLAALPGMGDAAADLRREAKQLADGALGDRELAETILREMLAADDADLWALAELTQLRDAAGDHAEVFRLLVRRAELGGGPDKVRDLRHAAAAVARDRLAASDDAIGLFRQTFDDDPTDAEAAAALRDLYGRAGKHRELLALLDRLVDVADSPIARAGLRLEAAKICLDPLGADDDAAVHLRSVLDEVPSDSQAVLLLSQLYEKLGKDEELAELLTSQIRLAEERSDVPAELTFRVRLGEVAETRLRDAAKAIETFAGVLERDPAHHGALAALARLHEQRGDKADAAKMLERILGLSSGEAAIATALHLADLYAALGDAPGLRRVLEQGLAIDSTAGSIRQRLLALYEQEGAWAELADLITGDARAAEAPADQVRLYQRAASIHMEKRDDPASAADLLERASELAPSDRDLLLVLCDAYSASGRGKQAIEALQKIVDSYGGRRSKELATIHHRLAKAHVADGNKEQALAELDLAFKIDPGSVAVLKDLGLLSLELAKTSEAAAQTGHLDRAQKTFRALLLQKLDGASPITKGEVFYYLGELSHRQGDDKKAIQMLERALDNERDLAPAKELLAKLRG